MNAKMFQMNSLGAKEVLNKNASITLRDSFKESVQVVFRYSLYYLAWFTSIAISGVCLWLLGSSLEQWYVVLGFDSWTHSFFLRSFFFIAGICWISIIFFAEGYFRNGILKQNLVLRIYQVFMSLFILFGFISLSRVTIAPYLGAS